MRGAPVPDRIITQQLNNKLATRGVRSPCKVTVQSNKGEVTLSGTVQFAHQKQAAVQLANGIAGVRRIIDQLIIKPTVKT
jgi:osmotically-inducible protein OsmY